MADKRKYKVVYERPKCIGAFACVATLPARWEVGEDSKANLIEGMQEGEQVVLEVELTDEELQAELEAAQVCPVNVIHVYDDAGKQLI